MKMNINAEIEIKRGIYKRMNVWWMNGRNNDFTHYLSHAANMNYKLQNALSWQ